MKRNVAVLLLAVVLLAGGSVWYARNRTIAPLSDTAGKATPSAHSAATSSPATSNDLDIPALEKELGIEIEEIEPPVSTVDTSDWKTYRNEEYGFEVKYPGGWRISDAERLDPGVKFIKTFSIISTDERQEMPSEDFIIMTRENFTVNEWAGITLADGDYLESINYFFKEGLKILRIHETANQSSGLYSPYIYFFKKDSMTYRFLGGGSTEEDSVIQTIFSTLTFF